MQCSKQRKRVLHCNKGRFGGKPRRVVLLNSNDVVLAKDISMLEGCRNARRQPSKGCIVKSRSALRIRKSAFNLLPLIVVFLTLLGLPAPASADSKDAAIVVDANTGRTLYARNADARRYPASLTKMMTLYILFGELESGRFSLNSRLSVSANAAAQPPSKLGVRAGSTVKVEDAILALTTKSANDVAVVVAENVSGSVSDFAARMNRTARSLGMRQTTFHNPNGLPDSGQMTTARDLAKLAAALQENYPTYYRYFGVRTFTYAGVRHRNHNHLLGAVDGVDGIKTGYTRASGFNLVTSVRRDRRHIIAVVMGGKSAKSRDAEMRELIADYLPAASRGRREDAVLIANITSNPDTAETPAAEADGADDETDVADAAADSRAPRPRPEIDGGAASAPATRPLVFAAAAPMAPVAQGDDSDLDEDEEDAIAERINTASAVAELAYTASEAEGGGAAIDRLAELARARAGGEDLIAAAAPTHSDDGRGEDAGWSIQIGATPTIEGAQDLIDKAKASMGQVLATLRPLTQEVERDGTTLYRARFAGFAGKEEARATCAELKSKAFACLAVSN
jgi:D-alanyl-D-alanine carboxypeptidase